MRTSGFKHLTTTTRLTSIVRHLDQASHLLLKLFTADRETETRSWAIQFSIATSIRTSLKVCGSCGGRMMYLKKEQCLTAAGFPLPVHARYLMAKSSPVRQHLH